MTEILERSINEIAVIRAHLCRGCKCQDDFLAVAAALLTEAVNIHEQIGGPAIAAKVLRGRADELDAYH